MPTMQTSPNFTVSITNSNKTKNLFYWISYNFRFQALSPEDYRRVMKLVETAILSTDLAMYFKKRSKFLELIENGEFDWQRDDKKERECGNVMQGANVLVSLVFAVLSGMMMTACDVSAIAKPWDVQHRVAKMVADEFFDQGDLEKMQLKEQPVVSISGEDKANCV